MTGRRPPLPALSLAIAALAVLAVVWFVVLPGWAGERLDRARSALAEELDRAVPPRGDGADGPGATAPPSLEEVLGAFALTADEGDRLVPLVHRPPAEWSPDERRMVTRLARREAEALARIERAGIEGLERLPARPEPLAESTGRTPETPGSDPLVELTAPLLRASHLLLARAGLALRAAPAEAGRSITALAGLNRALEWTPASRRSSGHPAVAAAHAELDDLFLRGAHWLTERPETPRPVLDDLRGALPTPSARDRILRMTLRLAVDEPGPERRGDRADAPPSPPAPRPTGLGDRLAPWRPEARRARELEALLDLVRASREPGRLREVARSAAGTLEIPETVDAMLHLQAAESARILARLALDLRLDPAPPTPPGRVREAIREPVQPPTGGERAGSDRDGQRSSETLEERLAAVPADPLAGARPESTPWVDGSLLLENSEAEAAWREHWGSAQPGRSGATEPPPYAWLLPPARSDG